MIDRNKRWQIRLVDRQRRRAADGRRAESACNVAGISLAVRCLLAVARKRNRSAGAVGSLGDAMIRSEQEMADTASGSTTAVRGLTAERSLPAT